MPYGSLYDRVMHFEDPAAWHNGDTTSKYRLYQYWWNIEHSDVTGSMAGSYNKMRAGADTEMLTNHIPVFYINYNVATLDSAALADGRLSAAGGILQDNNIAGPPPYLVHTLRTAGVPLEQIRVDEPMTFFYKPALYSLGNNGVNADSIVVTDVAEGVHFTLLPDAAYTLSVSTEGTHTLHLALYLSDGTVLSEYELYEVAPWGWQKTTGMGTDCGPTHDFIKSTIPFQGYDESYPTTSWGDYHIYYHKKPGSDDCEQVLRKPIIICDGYDANDGRDYVGIYTLLFYGARPQPNLAEDLRKEGYDVIILNFPKLGATSSWDPSLAVPKYVDKASGSGTVPDPASHAGRDGGVDYIERNAFVLVALINKFNTILAASGSTEKIVVVGPSMGGQISRYALAYMEQQHAAKPLTNPDPNVRLWVSFDSPHWGANIPLATQRTLYWFGHNAGQVAAKDAYDQKIHCPAGRQLLIEQLGGQNNTESGRQTYMYNIEHNGLPGSYGWPSYRAPSGTIRKIALLNGTGKGIPNGYAGEQYINATGKVAGITLFKIDAHYLQLPNTSGAYFSGISTTFIPFGPGSSLFGGFYLAVQPSIMFNTNNSNQRGTMDVVPGSIFTSTQDIRDQFSATLSSNGIGNQNWSILPAHTFIPTISALGFINPSFNWNTRVDNRALVCNNEIPFDNYYLPKENERHITLTTDNVAWLKGEIMKGHGGCPVLCASDLTGPSAICTGQTKTYSFSATLPAGTPVTWSVGSDLALVSSTSTTATVSYAASGGSGGGSYVKADITNSCGADIHLYMPVTVGVPLSAFGISPRSGNPCQGVGTAPMYAGTTYNWYSASGGSLTGIGQNVYCCADKADHITLQVSTACGTSGTTSITVPTPNVYCRARMSYSSGEAPAAGPDVSVQPNPSADAWHISFGNPDKAATSILLTDLTGKALCSIPVESTQGLDIYCKDLAGGLYFATVRFTDGSRETVRLQRK